jgi:chromosome segregation ATPase
MATGDSDSPDVSTLQDFAELDASEFADRHAVASQIFTLNPTLYAQERSLDSKDNRDVYERKRAMEEKRKSLASIQSEFETLSAAADRSQLQSALKVLGKDQVARQLSETNKNAFLEIKKLEESGKSDREEIGGLKAKVGYLERSIDEYKAKANSVDDLKIQHRADLLDRDRQHSQAIDELKKAHKAEVKKLQQDLGKANRTRSVLKAAVETLLQDMDNTTTFLQETKSRLDSALQASQSKKRKHDQIS